MGLVNEKELGESIVGNLAPRIVDAQTRLEDWAETLIHRLIDGHVVKIQVPLGDRTVTVTVELVPKSSP